MNDSAEQISSDYRLINEKMRSIASKIESNLLEIFSEVSHIDKIGCRVKAEESFLAKAMKLKDGKRKYQIPLKEIQDIIGARIVVYYKNNMDSIIELIKKYFHFVEETKIIPDDVMKFGYEGLHFICFIPSTIYSSHNGNPLIPNFFELQIKTLYQHAWSQAEHGLGYKPDKPLSYEEERKLAFLAAQSWGADMILKELVEGPGYSDQTDT
jgi:putative GTP pyrophosphokinase